MPEETKDFIKLPVEGEEGKHKKHIIRWITVSKAKGIKGLFCIDCKKIITFIFIKKKGWTMKKAEKWMKEHNKISSARLGEEGKVIFEHFDEEGNLEETVDQEQLIEAAEKADKSEMEKMLSEDRMIFMFGHIGTFTAEDIIKKLLLYDKQDSEKPVKLVIGSYGGDVYSSFAIIDIMEYVECPVETIGIGMVMSGGLLIFMAGDKRDVSQTASILSHRFWTIKAGSQAQLKADQVEDDRVHKRMIDHYIKFSKYGTKKEVEANLLKETNVWLTPEETIEHGLADEFFDKDWFAEETEDKESFNQGGDNDMIFEAIGGSRTLPLDKSPLWDADAAIDRMRRAAGGPKKEDMNWSKYQKGFIWYDPKNKDNFGGYKLPFADIKNGKLTAVWGGVNKAMGAILGARGGVDIPEKKAAHSFLSGYYKKFKKKPPKFHEGAKSGSLILESIKSLDWVEGDGEKPFRFSGVAFEADAESENEMFYPLDLVEKTVDEANEKIESMTVEMGHPKDDKETSPERIIGNVVGYELNEDNEVTFISELNNTRLGKDGQELIKSRPLGTQALSLRAGGDWVEEKAPDGHRRKRVIDMHLLGLDLVKAGGFKKAKVKKIGESDAGGEKPMTKEELLKLEEVQELLEETKDRVYQQVDKKAKEDAKEGKEELEKKAKEFETKLAEAEQAKEKAENELAEKKLAEFKELKIGEQKVSDKVKDLLRKRVSGKDEKEIEESIEAEMKYIAEVAPILKEGPEVHGIPPKGEDKPKGKSDEEVLKEGHERNWETVKESQQVPVLDDDED